MIFMVPFSLLLPLYSSPARSWTWEEGEKRKERENFSSAHKIISFIIIIILDDRIVFILFATQLEKSTVPYVILPLLLLLLQIFTKRTDIYTPYTKQSNKSEKGRREKKLKVSRTERKTGRRIQGKVTCTGKKEKKAR